MTWFDWAIVLLYFVASAAIGVYYARRAGRSVEEFFLSGRKLPWWVGGVLALTAGYRRIHRSLVGGLGAHAERGVVFRVRGHPVVGVLVSGGRGRRGRVPGSCSFSAGSGGG